MVRLGVNGYSSMEELISSLNTAGLGALELFCMGLKANGIYLSRTLSYAKAEFEVVRSPMSRTFRWGLTIFLSHVTRFVAARFLCFCCCGDARVVFEAGP